MLKRHFKRLLLILLLAATSAAQSSSELDPLKFEHITTKQGLSHNRINHFSEDSFGYIWLATDAGINRYDGENIDTIDPITPALQHLPIYASTRDSNNNLWLASDKGLIGIDALSGKSTLVQFPIETNQKQSSGRIIGVEVFKQQLLIISPNGLYCFTPKTRDIQLLLNQKATFKSNPIVTYTRSEKTLWFATKDQVFSFDIQKQELKPVTLDRLKGQIHISQLLFTKDNRLLIGGDKGLYLAMPLQNSSLIQLSDEPILAMTLNHNKGVYFATRNWLVEVNIISHKINKLISVTNHLLKQSDDKIKALFYDQQNRLWIATGTNGVFIWNSVSIQDIPLDLPTEILQQQSLRIFSLSVDGSLWVASDIALSHLSPNLELLAIIHFNDLGLDLSKDQFFSMVSDLERIWLYTSSGVKKFSIAENSVRLFDFPSNQLEYKLTELPMLVQNNEALWLSTDQGVLKFNSINSSYLSPEPIKAIVGKNKVEHLSYQNKKLWIAVKGEVFQFDEKRDSIKMVFKRKINSFGSTIKITQVLVVNNKLWVSTAGDGIYQLGLDTPNFSVLHHFSHENGFPFDNIIDLLIDKKYIIAISPQSISQIKISSSEISNHDFSSNHTAKTKFKLVNFNEKKRIISIDKDGVMNQILPSTLNYEMHATSPIISNITVLDSTQVKINSSLNHFSAHLNQSQWLKIDLVSSKINGLAPTQFEFWIEGRNNNRAIRVKHSMIFLKDLPVGKSQLIIRTIDPASASSGHQVKIDLNVNNDVWFIRYKQDLIYLAIILVIGYFSFRKYLHLKNTQQEFRHLAKNEERMTLALLDDRRGMWDCYIDQTNYLQSTFVIYLNRHKPLEITLEKYFTMVHEDERAFAIEAWRDFAEGKTHSFSSVYRCYFYQSWVWNRVYGKANAYDDQNRPLRATGIWTDINQEKKIENTLNLYSHAFQSTQDIVIILDNSLDILAVNQAYQDATGFPCKYLIGKSMLDIVRSRFTLEETKNIKMLVEQNQRWNGESSVPRRFAPSFPVDIRVNIIRKDSINSGYVVVMSDISQLKNSQNEVQHNHFYDSLTGLPNKTLVFDRLKELVKEGHKKNQSLTTVFLGIDDFEKLEKQLDKDNLNSLVTMFSQRILPSIGRNDFFARYEKDTFILILTRPDHASDILNRINQLLKEITRTFVIGDHRLDISACAGISRYPEDSNNWSELITQAETALAKTKKQGKNLFAYYHKDINQKALDRIAIENRLSTALQSREFFLVFQPIVNLENNKTINLDINIRWQIEENRISYPSQFLSIIEDIGLLAELYDWIIDSSFSSLRRWNQEGIKIFLNLNLSLNYLLQKRALDYLAERLEFYSVNPSSIFISITEQDVIEYAPELDHIDQKIIDLGFSLVLDDFGYSEASIKNLRRLNFHSIKLDRSLIRETQSSEIDAHIFAGIISLINQMDMVSIAKGVENEKQLGLINTYHCRYAQGFLMGDPMNENQTRQFLLEN